MDEILLKDLESKYADDTDEEEATGTGMPEEGSRCTSAAPADEADAGAQVPKDGLDISKGMEAAGPEDGFCEEDEEEYAEEEDSDEDVMAALEWADMRDGGLAWPQPPTPGRPPWTQVKL